jgi:hypothetical protein
MASFELEAIADASLYLSAQHELFIKYDSQYSIKSASRSQCS